MVASRSARERKAAAQAGPLAEVRVDVDAAADDAFVYKIACRSCTSRSARGGRAWSTYRTGEDNGFMAATDRWVFHLRERHVEVGVDEAPCLAYLPEAQRRLQERRGD